MIGAKKLTLLAAFALGACTTTPEPKPEPTEQQAEQPATSEQAPAPAEKAPEQGPLSPRPFQKTEPMQTIVLADAQKPIITFRLVFRTGSVDDPKGKEGLTALTADLMAEGGTKELSSSQLLEVLFPMAAELSAFTDKELTVFTGRVHQDNLDRFFKIFSDVLLEPRFDPQEFERLRADAVNQIRNELRGQNDEELGKVALDALLYEGHPYAHFVGGTVQGLQGATLDDVKTHWKNVFTQDRLIIGLAGNVTPELQAKVKERLSTLPPTGAPAVQLPPVTPKKGHAWILPKKVLSTAISMGYPYEVRRGDADFFPLALALSYLGEHRQFNGVLFNELREKRGLNYGNYAYPEHFIQEGWGTFPSTNVSRSQQDFSIWIRPVESKNAMFATRGALHFLGRLVNEGIPQDKFELTRGFLLGYTRLWEQTDSRRLGYALDAALYGTPDYLNSFRAALQKMTAADVNAAVKRHLSPGRMNFAYVAPDGEALKKLLTEQPPSTIEYASPKSEALLTEDKQIAVTPIPVEPGQIKILAVEEFMER